MNRIATILVVCMLVLGIFTFMIPRVKAQGGAPEWSIGDYWEYVGNGSYMGTNYDVVERVEVKGRVTVTVGNTTYDTFLLSVRESLTAGSSSLSIAEEIWANASDLATVKAEMEFLFMQMNTTFDPPQKILDFPLSDGKIWISRSVMTLSGTGMPEMNTTVVVGYEVSGPQSLTVPAGTFDAFNVTGTQLGGISSSFYSDQVGHYVKTSPTSTSGLAGLSMSPLELRTYNYQKANEVNEVNDFTWTYLVVIVGVIVLFVVIATVIILRKKRRMVPPTSPQNPPYGHPPQKPPAD